MLLDELAIKYQSESDQHREQLRLLEDSHSSQLEGFNTTLDDLKVNDLYLTFNLGPSQNTVK